MKIRYCMRQTQNRWLYSCSVGFGSITCNKDGTSKMQSCTDEPMEENCHNIIVVVDDEEDHLFFNNIRRDVIPTLKLISNSFKDAWPKLAKGKEG